jgi:hypothetical protein
MADGKRTALVKKVAVKVLEFLLRRRLAEKG